MLNSALRALVKQPKQISSFPGIVDVHIIALTIILIVVLTNFYINTLLLVFRFSSLLCLTSKRFQCLFFFTAM